VDGRPQAEDRVVVVDQRDLPVANIDVARHLDKGRFGGGYHAQRLADRAPVAGDHPVEQISRTRLITLQYRLRQHVEGFALANFVSIEQHCDPSPPAAGAFPQNERIAPAGPS